MIMIVSGHVTVGYWQPKHVEMLYLYSVFFIIYFNIRVVQRDMIQRGTTQSYLCYKQTCKYINFHSKPWATLKKKHYLILTNGRPLVYATQKHSIRHSFDCVNKACYPHTKKIDKNL